MIPKTIHYCWFGRNPLPPLAKKCIASWKKYCPDYEIIEWNEDNYDLSAAPLYVQQAYELKKWAFVTDYVRLQVVYENGGIYLDTDVELLKPLDPFLSNTAFFGFEQEGYVATGLGFGAERAADILYELMADYRSIPFILEDGSIDDYPCPKRNTKVFKKHGLSQNNSQQLLEDEIVIYPSSYFDPVSFRTGWKSISEETISIHHYAASWHDDRQREQRKQMVKEQRRYEIDHYIKHLPNRMLKNLIGSKRYEALKKKLKRN